jgi:hypothetical protein
MDVGNLAIAQEDVFRVIPVKQLIPTFVDDLRSQDFNAKFLDMVVFLRETRRIKLACILGASHTEWSLKQGVVILPPGTVSPLVSMPEGGKQT